MTQGNNDAPPLAHTMEIPSGTHYLTISEAAELLAEARHPRLRDELSLEAALQYEVVDGVHFSDARETTRENAALRRASTAVIFKAGLEHAVRDGRIPGYSPMTQIRVSLPNEWQGDWQTTISRWLLRVSDIAEYARTRGIQLVCAAATPPTTGTENANTSGETCTGTPSPALTRRQLARKRTEKRHARWWELADELSALHPGWSQKEIASKVAQHPDLENWAKAAAQTIRNSLLRR